MASVPQQQTELDLPVDTITAQTRRRVRAYFEWSGPDRPRQVLLVGGPAMLLLGLGAGFGLPRFLVAGLAGIALLVFAVAAVLAFSARYRATEAEIDVVRDIDFDRAQRLGRSRAQLVASDLRHPEACAFRNARAERDYRGAFVASKFGLDEKTRWTPMDITSVHFGHQQVFVHRCAIDLTTGDALYETTRELFYPDVLSVVTHGERTSRPLPKKKRAKIIKYWTARGGAIVNEMLQVDGPQTLSLRLASGEELEIARWEGVRDGRQPDEAPAHTEAAARLRQWLRAAKEQTAPIVRLPRIVRHSSTDV